MFCFKQTLKSLFTVLLTGLLLALPSMVLAQGNSNGNANSNASANAGNGNSSGNGSVNSGKKNKNIGVGNASNGIMGSLITDKRVYYTGNALDISLRFARGSELIVDGSVDAYVVIFSPSVSEDDEVDTGTGTDGDDSTGGDGATGGDDSTNGDGATGGDDSSGGDSSTDGDGATGGDTTTDENSEALTDAIVLPISDDVSSESLKLFEVEAIDTDSLPAGTYQLGLILTNPGGDPLNINDWYNGLLGLVDILGLTITDEAVDFDQDGDGQVDDDTDGDGFSDATVDEDGNEDSDSDTGSDTGSDS